MEAFHHFHSGMAGMSILVWGIVIFYIALLIGSCYLQVRLSKAEEWWKGLILPAIALIFHSFGNALAVVLLVIYGVNRYKIKKHKDEIEQMKIQDL